MTRRALIVDDSPLLTRVLVRTLEGQNCLAQAVSNAEAALEAARDQRIDVVLMDARMPGLSGESLYRALVGARPDLSTKVVVMSGDPDALEWASSQGLPVLQKPFELAELFTTINRITSQST